MIIHFKNRKEELIFSNNVILSKKYNKQIARKINKILKVLDSADNLLDLPHFCRCHPLNPKKEEIFSIDISKHNHPLRLKVCLCGEYIIKNYKTIKEIKILKIEEIHS